MKQSLSIKDYHCIGLVLEAIDRIEEYTSVYYSADEFNTDYLKRGKLSGYETVRYKITTFNCQGSRGMRERLRDRETVENKPSHEKELRKPPVETQVVF